jgi:hypothetical protein
MNEQTWAQWVRSNFDKFLLLVAFFGIVSYVIHLVHHNSDNKIIDWAQNLAGQAFAAFLTMVTGSLMRQSSTAPPSPLPPGSTATTQSVVKTVTPPAQSGDNKP